MPAGSINTNVPSLVAQRSVNTQSALLGRSLERLATGSRINRGADDPSGLIASENLKAVMAQLDAESRAAERSSAVASVADAALGEVSDLLIDAESAAVANASTGGLSQAEREANQMVIDSALQAVDRIASTTTFNGQRLLDGSATLRYGDETQSIDSVSPTSLGQVDINGQNYRLSDTRSGGALSTVNGNAEGAQQSIRAAAGRVASLRGEIGSFQRNVLDSALRANDIAFENTAAANSIIRDADFAAETAEASRRSILRESSIRGAIAANGSPRALLGLLG